VKRSKEKGVKHNKNTLTKLFKETQIKIAFRTRYTIQDIVKPQSQTDKYDKSGIYQIKCLDCPLKYIGQTGRTFHARYEEHMQAVRNNNSNSEYANHILNMGHTYGITDTMDIIKTEKRKASKH
jgi:hypothetical protein